MKKLAWNSTFKKQSSWHLVPSLHGKCCCCSVTKSCPTLYDPINCSMSGYPVLHYVPEFAQTHIHWVVDARQPYHSLTPPSPLALSLSQHQGPFQWVSSSHQVAKVLSFSFSINPLNGYLGLMYFRIDWFESPCSPRNLQEPSPTPQFESINS